MKIDWIDGIKLEIESAIILREQEENGVYFDTDLAYSLIQRLETLKEEQEEIIRPYLTYQVLPLETKDEDGLKYVKKVFLKNGSYTSSVVSHYPEDPGIVEGPFSRVSIEEPSITKRQVIITQLLKLGWKPKLFTETGLPKLTEKGEPVDTLSQVGDFGKALALYYTYCHRQSQIEGFFKSVREDHRIPAICNVVGTNTFRCRHSVVANIPRPTSIFGKEMRALFRVAPGRKFVGADLSGLELRMLCHYMRDEEYTSQVLTGDIHTYNMEKAGLPTRNDAKTFIFGWLYGAGNAKIGSIIGKGEAAGKKIKEQFMKEIPSLSNLVNKVKSFSEKNGFIPSIDGRKIYLRSYEDRLLIHTALNCLLQGSGSIVAKRAMVIANREIKRRGLDSFQIIFYHDELAYDSAEDCAEEVGKILVDSMRLAGEYYSMRIPIAGEYGIGGNWGIH